MNRSNVLLCFLLFLSYVIFICITKYVSFLLLCCHFSSIVSYIHFSHLGDTFAGSCAGWWWIAGTWRSWAVFWLQGLWLGYVGWSLLWNSGWRRIWTPHPSLEGHRANCQSCEFVSISVDHTSLLHTVLKRVSFSWPDFRAFSKRL